MMLIKDKWAQSATEWTPLSPVAGAYYECVKDMVDASTPRPPKVEWFKLWPHWSMNTKEHTVFGRNAIAIDIPDDDALHAAYVKRAALCVPVEKEWPHAFVGWGVVGG